MRFHERRSFLQFTDKTASFSHEELKHEQQLMNARSGIYLSDLRKNIEFATPSIKSLFFDGVKTSMFITPAGKILTVSKVEKFRYTNPKGYYIFKYNTRYSKGEMVKKVHLMVAEAFLIPKGDNIKVYKVGFKDGNKSNCSADNLIVKKRGSMGIAIKKEVSVFKNNRFVATFDSISRCAEALSLSRRRISEKLNNSQQNIKGFSFICE